jgi:hypothetical protein
MNGSPVMPAASSAPQSKASATAPRTSGRIKDADEAAWLDVFDACDDPTVAAVVIKLFKEHPALSGTHLGLLCKARVTIERRQAQIARRQRIGQAVRAVFTWPLRLFRKGASNAMTAMSDIATMPDMTSPSEFGLRATRGKVSKPPALPPTAATGT